MKQKLSAILCSLLFLVGTTTMTQAQIYVSTSGSNSNAGTKGQPMKNIEKAIEKASPGQKIHVAKGEYKGVFGSGKFNINKGVELLGGYSDDFAERNPHKHLTKIVGKPGPGPTVQFSFSGGKATLSGFYIDNSVRNTYEGGEHKDGFSSPTILLNKVLGNAVVDIVGNTFSNASGSSVHIDINMATINIMNNLFVGDRKYSVKVTGNAKGNGINIEKNTFVYNFPHRGNEGVQITFEDSYAPIHIKGNLFVNHRPSIHIENGAKKDVSITGNAFVTNGTGVVKTEINGTKVSAKISELGDIGITATDGNVSISNPFEVPASLAKKSQNKNNAVKVTSEEVKAFFNNSSKYGAKPMKK